MNSLQDKKYWRRWKVVSDHNHWRMSKGRLSPEAVLAGSAPHEQAVAAAKARALQHHRSLTADDLRHGCHVAALGHDKSHTAFSNRDFDKLLCWWGDERSIVGLLLQPAHLGSEIHRANPDLQARVRHLKFLHEDCLGGYVVSECERIFGTKDWEALRTEELLQLSNHLRARPNALRESKRIESEPIDPELVPF